MAPPSHADKDNLSSMQEIVDEFLSPERIREFGILDETEVNNLLNKFFSSELDASEKVQLDAIINHLLSVQILYKIFIIEISQIRLKRWLIIWVGKFEFVLKLISEKV